MPRRIEEIPAHIYVSFVVQGDIGPQEGSPVADVLCPRSMHALSALVYIRVRDRANTRLRDDGLAHVCV